MTEPTQDATAESSAPEEVVFTVLQSLGLPEDTPSYTVTKPVQFQQLEDEIKAASGATQVEISFTDFDVQDADNPVTVYVVGAKTKKSVNDAIEAHVADPRYGWSEEQTARADALAVIQDPNGTPTVEDLTVALRAILKPLDAAPVEEVPA